MSFFLNETHLTKTHRLSFDNYAFIRKDKTDNKNTGIGILIKNNIKHTTIEIPENIRNLEHIIIKLQLSNTKFIFCICIYINHIHNRNIETKNFDIIFNALDLKNQHFIILDISLLEETLIVAIHSSTIVFLIISVHDSLTGT